MELVARAIKFLDERGCASAEELAEHVFGGAAFTALLPRLVDERIVCENGAWRLRTPAASSAVLELLTSGPDPRRHRLIEVAAQRDGRHFQATIASTKSTPKLLRKWGVPERGTATRDEVAAGLRDFLGGATVVGFSYVPDFLEALLGPRWPAIDLLCLVYALSDFGGRPDPPRLARHFGLPEPLSRRPERMLAFSEALFSRLRGRRTLHELRELGQPRPLSPPQRPALPEGQPGVYVMSSRTGTPLYVGKSVDVRRRVGSYLGTPIAESRGMYHLLELTERIEVIPVNSELEALLLESRLIAGWLPPFNVQRSIRQRRAYIRLSTEVAFPRLTLATAPAADGATYFGPFRHATAAARLRELLAAVLRLRTCTRVLPSPRKPQPACDRAATGECLAPCIPGPPLSSYDAEGRLARELLSATPEEFRRRLLRLLRQRPPSTARALKLKRHVEGLRITEATAEPSPVAPPGQTSSPDRCDVTATDLWD